MQNIFLENFGGKLNATLWSIDYLNKGYIFFHLLRSCGTWNPLLTILCLRMCCYIFVNNHLCSRIEKRVVRCIFIGYDSPRIRWWYCYQITGNCYISWDVIFDEASSCWSLNKELMPFLSLLIFTWVKIEMNEDNEDGINEDVTQNQWITRTYQ